MTYVGVACLGLSPNVFFICFVGTQRFPKNCGSHIDASLSRQPLVKGERLVRYEVNAVMLRTVDAEGLHFVLSSKHDVTVCEHWQRFGCQCCVLRLLGRSPPKNCKNDLDDQT